MKDFVRNKEAAHSHRITKGKRSSLSKSPGRKIQDHPFLAMAKKTSKAVIQELKTLRGGG